MRKIKIVDVTDANFDSIPRPTIKRFNCKECFYWIGKKDGRLDQKVQKRKWLSRKSAGFGSLSKVLFVNGESEPVGFIQFGPIKEFETAKLYYLRNGILRDGWCITCVTIRSNWRRQGLAQALVKSVLQDLKRRGIDQVDVYPQLRIKNVNESSVGSTQLWQKLGFKVVAEDSREVIMRKELHHGTKQKNST